MREAKSLRWSQGRSQAHDRGKRPVERFAVDRKPPTAMTRSHKVDASRATKGQNVAPLSGGLGPRPHCGMRSSVNCGISASRALRGPRPPASLRGRLLAGVVVADAGLSGGLGPRPHCGVGDFVPGCPIQALRGPRPPASLRDVDRDDSDDGVRVVSPGASAPGLIAGSQPLCGGKCWCQTLRGPRPPASLRDEPMA